MIAFVSYVPQTSGNVDVTQDSAILDVSSSKSDSHLLLVEGWFVLCVDSDRLFWYVGYSSGVSCIGDVDFVISHKADQGSAAGNWLPE